MFCDLSLPATDAVFASDAPGAGELSTEDAGGFGIVAVSVPKDLVLDCWRSSFMPGKTITKLDGSLGTKFKSRLDLKPTVPFSRLPAPLFERDRLVRGSPRPLAEALHHNIPLWSHIAPRLPSRVLRYLGLDR